MTVDPARSAPGSPAVREPIGRAILVTLAVLATYRIGSAIPLPGIDVHQLQNASAGANWWMATDRFSVLALGIMPFFNALLLAELGRLLLPPFRRWSEDPHTGSRSFYQLVLWLGLGFAALQAYGIAVALNSFPNIVTEPGTAFILPATVTILTGAVVCFFLAQIITRHGLGHGMWWLFALPVLMSTPGMLAALVTLFQDGVLSGPALFATLAVTAASVAAVALIHRSDVMTPADAASLIWPPVLGAWAAGFLGLPGVAVSNLDLWPQFYSGSGLPLLFAATLFFVIFGILVGTGMMKPGQALLAALGGSVITAGIMFAAPGTTPNADPHSWVGPGRLVNTAATALLVGILAWVYAHRLGRNDGLVRAALLAAIVTVPELLLTYAQTPWIFPGSMIVIVTVLFWPFIRPLIAWGQQQAI